MVVRFILHSTSCSMDPMSTVASSRPSISTMYSVAAISFVLATVSACSFTLRILSSLLFCCSHCSLWALVNSSDNLGRGMVVSLPFSNSILMSSLYLVPTWTFRASHEVVSRSAESGLPKSNTWGPRSLQAPFLGGWAAAPGNGAMAFPLYLPLYLPLPELPLPLGLTVMVSFVRLLACFVQALVSISWESFRAVRSYSGSPVQCHVPLSQGFPRCVSWEYFLLRIGAATLVAALL
jgi:hypothetical protein